VTTFEIISVVMLVLTLNVAIVGIVLSAYQAGKLK
jgi:hypothetical protein